MRRCRLVLAICAAVPLAAPAAPSPATPVSRAGTPPIHRLSLRAAVASALATNVTTRVAIARRAVAAGSRVQARAAFLPHLTADVAQSRQQVNLAAQGFAFNLPGFSPVIAYDSFQARARLRENLFDYSAWQRYQGAKIGERVAAARIRLARQQVASKAELDYVAALAAEQAVAAARADAKQADKLLTLARDQAHQGLATGVDVTRAQTRQARMAAALAQAKTARVRAKIQLARTTGLPLDARLVLSDRLAYRPVALGDRQPALARALADRPEIEIAKSRIERGEKQLAAARGERLPKLSVSAAYGSAGNTYNHNENQTYRIGAQISVPLFDGGAIRGEIDSAASRLDVQRIRYRDARREVEQDVRVAARTLATLRGRVRAARTALKLATMELARARDRFAHGVGDNIEVVDAQSALADARNTRISALAAYTRARINFAAALGRARQFRLNRALSP